MKRSRERNTATCCGLLRVAEPDSTETNATHPIGCCIVALIPSPKAVTDRRRREENSRYAREISRDPTRYPAFLRWRRYDRLANVWTHNYVGEGWADSKAEKRRKSKCCVRDNGSNRALLATLPKPGTEQDPTEG